MECSAIALVVIGVVLATVTDSTVMTNMLGCLLSGAAILFSAVYQVRLAPPASTPLCEEGPAHAGCSISRTAVFPDIMPAEHVPQKSFCSPWQPHRLLEPMSCSSNVALAGQP